MIKRQMNGYFIGYMNYSETQAEVYVVSIDPGVCTSFTWYFSTKGVNKIGEYDIGCIFYLCKHMDNLISKKDKLVFSTSK